MTEIYDFDIEIEDDGGLAVSLSGTLSGRAYIDREDGVSCVHRMEHLHFFGHLGVYLYNTDVLRRIPIDTDNEDFINWVIDEFVGWDWVDDQIMEGQTHV